jgi:ribosome recycling factor
LLLDGVITMSDEIIEEVSFSAEERMDSAVNALDRDLTQIRSGRASPTLVENLIIEAYGTNTPLQQVASISVPEAQLITIQPYDASIVDAVMRAVQTSQLGITPSTDGKLIRLPVPALTQERRKELVKQVQQKAEESRISIRGARRSANDEFKKLNKSGDIGDDDERRGLQGIENLTKQYIGNIDKKILQKEQDLMEI